MAPPQMTSSGPSVLARAGARSGPPPGEHLPVVAQVAGEEDDEQDLRDLAGLERDRPELHPERRAVDRRAETGSAGRTRRTIAVTPSMYLTPSSRR